jgi:hypothetical protein
MSSGKGSWPLAAGLALNALAISVGCYWIGATQRYQPGEQGIIVDGYSGASIRCFAKNPDTILEGRCGYWLPLPPVETSSKRP